jgi:catalase
VRHHQRDGFHQDEIHRGRVSYHPNSLAGGCPAVPGADGGYVHYPERVEGAKVRLRSETFADHYGQATLFWNSMSAWEKEHIVAAYRFELGKVEHPHIRQRVVEHLNHVDHDLATAVAAGIGVPAPGKVAENHGRGSAALSQANSAGGVLSRRVAILVADGVEGLSVLPLRDALQRDCAIVELLGPVGGQVRTADGSNLAVDRAMNTMASVLYDAVVVPDGADATAELAADGYAVHFVAEAYKHAKPVGAIGTGVDLLARAQLPVLVSEGDLVALSGLVAQPARGAVGEPFIAAFVAAIAAHRHFDRLVDAVPA